MSSFSSPVNFTLANNQSSPANVTGVLLSSSNTVGFVMDYSLSRIFTSGFVAGNEDVYVADTVGIAATGAFNNAFQIGQQSTGKMVFVGSSVLTSFNGQYVPEGIIRLNSDFTLDSAFTSTVSFGFNNSAIMVAIDSSDKILAVGSFTTYNGTALPGSGSIVRLNSDGSLDTTFITNLGTGFNQSIAAVKIQADGKILLGGSFTTFNGNTRNRIVRLNSDGTEDTTFATNLGTGVNANSVQSFGVDSSGNIIFTGNFASVNGTTTGKICRLTSSGTVDATWNTNVGTTGFGTVPTGCVTLSNDQTIFFGNFTAFKGNTRNHLVRLNSDGTEDTTFYTNLGTGAFNNGTNTVTQDTAATMLFVGGSFTAVGTNTRVRMAVLNFDGTDNSTFNTALGFGFSSALAQIFILADGRALVITGASGFFNRISKPNILALYTQTSNANLNGTGTLSGYYNPESSTWILNNANKSGDTSSVTFSMTSGGQLQYTTTNLAGTSVTNNLRYVLKTL